MSTPSHTIGDAPIQEAYRVQMRAIADAIDALFNGPKPRDRKVGFILLAFPFGHKGRCNYISNAERADVIVLMKEQLAYFEGMPSREGHG